MKAERGRREEWTWKEEGKGEGVLRRGLLEQG